MARNKETLALFEKSLNHHYDKAVTLALIIVEEKARTILREHKNLNEFIMAMEGWLFTRKGGGADYDNVNCLKYMRSLQNFVSEWDDVLKITGESMRFTADGEKITDWGITG